MKTPKKITLNRGQKHGRTLAVFDAAGTDPDVAGRARGLAGGSPQQRPSRLSRHPVCRRCRYGRERWFVAGECVYVAPGGAQCLWKANPGGMRRLQA